MLELDIIVFEEGVCDLLVVSVEDEFFLVFGDVCYKIFRIYYVINWCEYDGESFFVVVGRDEDCDGLRGDEVIWVIVKDGEIFFDVSVDLYDGYFVVGIKVFICDGLINLEGYWINSLIDIDVI